MELYSGMDLRTERDRITLDGEWEFTYDPDDRGTGERWFEKGDFPETANVPGCAQAREYASAQMTATDYAEERKKHGAVDMRWPVMKPAWYRCRFVIPCDWQGREVWLQLGGVMPAVDFWLNGTHLGTTRSSRSPVRCNLTTVARVGEENVLVLRLFRPEGPALDGCFDFCAPFSGLYRSVWVEAADPVHVRELFVRTVAIDPPCVVVEALLSRRVSASSRFLVEVRDATGVVRWATEQAVVLDADGESRVALALVGAELWSPASPVLYTARVVLSNNGRELDRADVRFGIREIRREGDRILLNNTPIYLRGGCDDHNYPETVCPPASKGFYLARLRKTKAFGFNYTKSCHEVFTEEFLEAADELGLMVCQEMPFGLGSRRWTAEKCGRDLDPEEADFLREEFSNIIRARRNHPCIVTGSAIGEIAFDWMSESVHRFLCWELPSRWQTLQNVLVMDLTCGFDWSLRDHTKQGRRFTDVIEDNGAAAALMQEPLSHPLQPTFRLDRPGMYHEYNWITSLPEPELESRYADLPTFSSGVVDLERSAEKAGFSDQLPLFVANSRRLKRFLQKEALELARRNPNITGYHFWLMHGFSWCQEGVLNEFWDMPEDITADEFVESNADVVVLLDDNNCRTFLAGRAAPLSIQISNFGPLPLSKPMVTWRLSKDDEMTTEGIISLPPVGCGVLSGSSPVNMHFPIAEAPTRHEFSVILSDSGTDISRNRWSLWSVPAVGGDEWAGQIATDLPFVSKAFPGIRQVQGGTVPSVPVMATNRVTPALLDWLEQGGRLVLFAGALRDYRPGQEYRPGEVHPEVDSCSNRYSNLYRSPPWGVGQEGNMGTVVVDHPALGGFPHEGWCDAPFVPLIHGAYPLVLGWFRPDRVEPVIRAIGHPSTMVDKAYLFEVKVGRGAALATSLCFESDAAWKDQPQTPYLLAAFLRYTAGEQFLPRTTVSRATFQQASSLAGK